MRARAPLRSIPSLLLLAFVALASACDRAPSASGLKEWAPSDHDRAEEQGRIQSGQQATAEPKGEAGSGNVGGVSTKLIEIAWQQNCAVCHGVVGRGDGPNGPMVKAPDLTREEWQDKVTDDEIAAMIKGGKDKMPKFDLPEPVLRGIIARIRASRGR
jgi:cytochrome c oxidase cbb3-type subunit 3